ncbi:Integrase/recombinase [Commensalibacter communis]|nr:Integrase/recombinase [Commensalibacter communis]
MHSDGGNLYLSIRGNSRAWVFRFKSPTIGKIRMLGLGSLPDITLDHAREVARQSREMLRNDLNPLQQKQSGKLAVKENRKTFEMVAKEYIEDRSKRWRGKSTKAEIEASCLLIIFTPSLGVGLFSPLRLMMCVSCLKRFGMKKPSQGQSYKACLIVSSNTHKLGAGSMVIILPNGQVFLKPSCQNPQTLKRLSIAKPMTGNRSVTFISV